MSVPEIAAEIDRTPRQTAKLLKKHSYLVPRPTKRRQATVYPASSVEVLKAVLAIPHRPVPTSEGDWLTEWIGDPHHVRGL